MSSSIGMVYSVGILYYYITVLSGNLWLEVELEPEPKINNFGFATLCKL